MLVELFDPFFDGIVMRESVAKAGKFVVRVSGYIVPIFDVQNHVQCINVIVCLVF